MHSSLPGFVAERFRRRAPDGVRIVEGSTPVVSFGDVREARIATLAINPSFNEFPKDGRERDGKEQRLETLLSLRCECLSTAPNVAIRRAFESCNSYFTRNPYGYFRRLETILQRVAASFSDGSACHLDLVQWATKPRWRDLAPWEKNALLRADTPFLRSQLRSKSLCDLLINGSGVREQYERFFSTKFTDASVPASSDLQVSKGPRITFFQGRTEFGQRVFGWNINLPSTPGVSNDNVKAIAREIARLFKRSA